MPASTNFLQFNAGAVNTENDASYSADALRTGGITTAAIFPSPTANKMFYQWSIFIAAFCQMLVNKGYSPSDANFSNLVSVLMNVKTASEFLQGIVTVPYATSVTFDCSVSLEFDLTLTGDATSSITNTVAGQLLVFIISQDGTGNHAFTWPVAITSPGAICPYANSISVQMFVVRPGGAIVPLGKMLWITSTGIVFSTAPAVIGVSASGNVSSAYEEIVEKVDASAGSVTRTLFTAVGYGGRKVTMKKMDSNTGNTATLAAQAGQTIDGQPNFPLSRQFDAISVISDNANWVLF